MPVGISEAEVDRRILHSETRIKSWVIGGVLANLILLASVGLPYVYFAGQTAKSLGDMADDSKGQTEKFREMQIWMRNHEILQQSMQIWMENQGYRPPYIPSAKATAP